MINGYVVKLFIIFLVIFNLCHDYNQMRSEKSDSRTREDKQLLKKIQYRLSLANIRFEHDLIVQMNSHLEIDA